jgi:predicted DNA-binding transcriptional regulator YafY
MEVGMAKKNSGTVVNEEMATRFQRLLSIVRKLSQPKGATVTELAQLYGVDARTIQRDILLLRDACFDIESLGRGKGMRLDPRHKQIAQTLGLEELLCLVVGARLVQGDSSVDSLRESALQKVIGLAKNERQTPAREIHGQVAVGSLTPQHPWLPELLRATASRTSVHMEYQASERQEISARLIDPWTLLYQSEAWFVQGYCHLRQERRTFRVHRIRRLEVTEQTFSLPEHYSAESATFHRWDLREGAETPILCRVEPELAAWLRENPVHPSQQLRDGHFAVRVRDLDRFGAWVLSLSGLEVIEPQELRDSIRSRAETIARRYSSPVRS